MKFIFFSRYGFQNLLVCFFLYLLVGPFLESIQYAHVVMDVLLTAVLILAVRAIHKKEKLFWCTHALLYLSLIFLWVERLGFVVVRDKVTSLLLCLYFSLLVYSFLKYIFAAKRIDANLISATLCLYLILGILWGTVYGLLEAYIPGSFAGDLLNPEGSLTNKRHYFTYFSYITLTTLGYGDILPKTPVATALCQVEAILGQFFTAVLVARLVGIQVAQQFTGEN